MPDAVFRQLVAALRQLRYAGRISYHFYSEPLLRPDLERLVGIVTLELPRCFQLLFSNGDLLTDQRYEALRRAGIDHFVVTRHDGSSFPGRPSQTVLVPDDLILTNRGGLLTEVAQLPTALQRPCYAPTDMLVVAANGDVLLCCDDSERTQVMGNVMVDELPAIWTSPRFRRARALLQEGRRAEASPICASCSNTEYFGPGENYQKDIC